MITKVGSNNLCFTAAYIERCGCVLNAERKKFLDPTHQKLIDQLSERGIDCLFVKRDDGTVLIQLGKMIQNKFNLFYVTETLENFKTKFQEMLKQATDPKYLAKQQEKAGLRAYAREVYRPVVALPKCWFNKG